MRTRTINGLDVEESWHAIADAMAYVRKERKPFLLEARVSRLYGHSSASGANFVEGEADPIVMLEQQIEKAGWLSRKQMDDRREEYNLRLQDMAKEVRQEPMPDASTIYDHTYADQKGKYW